MLPATLPPLSPADRSLLTTYLSLDQDLPALAAHLACGCHGSSGSDASRASTQDSGSPSVPSCPGFEREAGVSVPSDYFSLLLWLAQPHIRAILDAHDLAAARADHAQSRIGRRLAASALRQAIDAADSPTERRRAATSLARATNSPAPSSWNRLREQATPPASARPSRAHSRESLNTAIRTLTRPTPSRVDEAWLDEALELARRAQSPPKPPPASNGHTHAAPHSPRAAPAPRTQGLQSPGSSLPSPPSPPSPPLPLYTDPILQPISRLPLTPNPAARLRANAGAAPSLPPSPRTLPWLTPQPSAASP